MPIVLKSGSLNLLEPTGPVQACNRTAVAYTQGGPKVGIQCIVYKLLYNYFWHILYIYIYRCVCVCVCVCFVHFLVWIINHLNNKPISICYLAL